MQNDGYSELLKVAPKRLADAWELLETPSRDPNGSDASRRHLSAAWYLAGYAVECILKVYTIMLLDARTNQHLARRGWEDVIEHLEPNPAAPSLRGKHSHNLRRLRIAAELDAEMDADEKLKKTWGICSRWDYNARYEADLEIDRESVQQFVEACEAAYHWVRNRAPFGSAQKG